jgi:cyclopropane fatty-acyl-phospholipid synthase-like methyltransferase
MLDPAPYDLIAEQWSQERKASRFREKQYVDRFLEIVEAGGRILDLGCGSGVPIMRYLLDHGCRVTGLDASAAMLQLARTNCPEAELIAGEMTSVEIGDRYHGIVAWDSILHIPKAKHGELFYRMREWLTPGAPVLLSVGGSEDEFTAPMFEVEFFYSGHAPDMSVALLRDAGFDILIAEIDDPSSRGHFAILCRKTSNHNSRLIEL